MILAIDPGTKGLGIAVFHPDGTLLAADQFEADDEDFHVRMMMMVGVVDAHFTRYTPIMRAVCEEPFLQGKAQTQMQRLLGAIYSLCHKHGVECIWISPMTVKAQFQETKGDKFTLFDKARKWLVDRNGYTRQLGRKLVNAKARQFTDMMDAVSIGAAYFKRLEEREANESKIPSKANAKS